MRFTADLGLLPQMLCYICEQARQRGVSAALVSKIELACEEAIVNIVSYAFPQQKGEIEISFAQQGQRFEVIIQDKGRPFNPIESEIDPQFDVAIQERFIGGLGIFLIRKLMDESTYQRVNDTNILRMAIRLDVDHD